MGGWQSHIPFLYKKYGTGWMDGQVDGRAGLRIAYSNQKFVYQTQQLTELTLLTTHSPVEGSWISAVTMQAPHPAQKLKTQWGNQSKNLFSAFKKKTFQILMPVFQQVSQEYLMFGVFSNLKKSSKVYYIDFKIYSWIASRFIVWALSRLLMK